jgi:hypothetical protein
MAVQSVTAIFVIAVWGVIETVRADLPWDLTIIPFAVLGVLLVLVDLYQQRRLDPAHHVEELPGSEIEDWSRTALRTVLVLAPFLGFVVAGLFIPELGVVAGGGMTGLLFHRAYRLLHLLRIERRTAQRQFIEVSPRTILATVPHPAYFWIPEDPTASAPGEATGRTY